MNKPGTDKQYCGFFCYTIQLITIKFEPNSRILIQVVAEKSLTEKNV